jgi:hypothetical protein
MRREGQPPSNSSQVSRFLSSISSVNHPYISLRGPGVGPGLGVGVGPGLGVGDGLGRGFGVGPGLGVGCGSGLLRTGSPGIGFFHPFVISLDFLSTLFRVLLSCHNGTASLNEFDETISS